MGKQRTVTLCGCLAALPLLIGCANGVEGPPQAYAPPAPAAFPAADAGSAPNYAIGPGVPAAILVMLPSPGDALSADPRVWAAQGFDAMTASPSEMYQLAADQPAALARLIAEAQAVAAAPVWLVGANPAIAAAMASMPFAPGQVSGVVITSTNSGAGSCSERMTYSYSGNGTPPKVSVSRSGNACPAGSPFGAATNPTVAPPLPPIRPNAPRVIEAAEPTNGGAAVQQVADLIKSTSPN